MEGDGFFFGFGFGRAVGRSGRAAFGAELATVHASIAPSRGTIVLGG